jgi:hypothetical protein
MHWCCQHLPAPPLFSLLLYAAQNANAGHAWPSWGLGTLSFGSWNDAYGSVQSPNGFTYARGSLGNYGGCGWVEPDPYADIRDLDQISNPWGVCADIDHNFYPNNFGATEMEVWYRVGGN